MAQIKPSAGVDDRIALAEALPLQSPLTLDLYPANACNFKCVYCAHSLSQDEKYAAYGLDKSMMSIETMAAIVEQSKQFSKPYKLLSFMGHGEPLLNRDLPQMIAMASEAEIAGRIEIVTNGSMLTHELSDELIASGLSNLRISLNGLDSDTYFKTCGVSIDFDRFLERITYFYHKKKSHMGLFVKIIDSSLNPSDEQRFYSMFDGICDRMSVEGVQPVYHIIPLHVNVDTDLKRGRYGHTHPPRKVCHIAFFSVTVWPNGDVQPCYSPYGPCLMGNVHTSSLHEMWRGDTLRQFRIRHLLGEKNMLTGCVHCCAPDDVSHAQDVLDGHEERLIKQYSL